MDYIGLASVFGYSAFIVGYQFYLKNQKRSQNVKVDVIKPLQMLTRTDSFSVFTAGSIEMGKAEDWQTLFSNRIQEEQNKRLMDNLHIKHLSILNPRRDDWSSEWNKNKFHPLLVEQIQWELHHLNQVNWIIMYFDGNTISPISLLELGLFAKSKKIVVYCPNEYFRVENVVEVCKQNNIPLAASLDELVTITMKNIYK